MSRVLLTIAGNDQPGITAAISTGLGKRDITILDIEQAVTHNQLCLNFLLDSNCKKEIETIAKQSLASFNVKIFTSLLDGEYLIANPNNRFVITIMSDEIKAELIAKVSSAIANFNANIDSIRKLSSGGVSTLEFIASAPSAFKLSEIKSVLYKLANEYPNVDVATQRENLYRRSKRLIVFDMDSTLIQQEVIDELANETEHSQLVKKLTKEAMEGKIDFQESLLKRTHLLAGISISKLELIASKLELTPGTEVFVNVLKKLGFKLAIISGGFTYFAERLKEKLGIHYVYANQLEIENGLLTGNLKGIIIDAKRKADLLELLAQQEGILLDQVIAIGDGANDLYMLEKAGLGIAFNAKPVTQKTVGNTITDRRMDSVLYLMGITETDIQAMSSTTV